MTFRTGGVKANVKNSYRPISFLAFALAFLAAATPLMAQKAAPKPISKPAPPPIAYYPGGSVELEVSLSSEDLLPFAMQFAEQMLPKATKAEDTFNELGSMFQDVKAVYILQQNLGKQADSAQVIGFFSTTPEKRGFTRVLRQVQGGQSLFVWSGKGGVGMYGLRLSRNKAGEMIVQAARLEGKLDFASIARLASGVGLFTPDVPNPQTTPTASQPENEQPAQTGG